MAFLRAHMTGRTFDEAGDPFRFRIPKRLRKLKVGRALGKLARIGAGFVPGLGQVLPMLDQAVPDGQPVYDPIMAAPEPVVSYPPEVVEFARGYGVELGDPMPKPGRRGAPVRPTARTRRQPHAVARPGAKHPVTQHASQSHGSSARGKVPAKGGHTFAPSINIDPRIAGTLKDHLAGAISQLRGGNLAGAAGQALLGTGARIGGGFGGGHRKMNPANVKAIRRATRRLDGFEKLVKRVMPHLLTKHRTGASHPRAHKRGCRCVVCKHK